MNKSGITKTAIIANLLTGCFLLFFGIFMEPIMPHVLISHVLTQEELTNESTRTKMLELLTKANGTRWIFWCSCGLVCVCSSVICLRNFSRSQQ